MIEETTGSTILAIIVSAIAILAVMAFASNALTGGAPNAVILSIDTSPASPAPLPVETAPLQPAHTITNA